MFHIHRQRRLKGPNDSRLQRCDGNFNCRKHPISVHLFQEQNHEEHRQLLYNEHGFRRFPPDLGVHAADDEQSLYRT